MRLDELEDVKGDLARLRYDLAGLRFELIERKYRPDQARTPAGNSTESGRWVKTAADRAGLRGEQPIRGFRKQDPSLHIPHPLSDKLNGFADDFYLSTGRDLVVTSGSRNPVGQAKAMFEKFSDGASGDDYVNQKALKEIRDAYDEGAAAGLSKDEVVENMRSIIQSQVNSGIFVSKHLNNGAADVSVTGLNSKERRQLYKSARASGFKVHPEGHPRHLHVELKN